LSNRQRNPAQSAVGRQALQQVVAALRKGKAATLLVIAREEKILDEAGRDLVKQLRAPDVQLGFHRPGNAEGLVQQVNHLLVDLPLSLLEASGTADGQAAPRILIIDAAHELDDEEVATLLQLLRPLAPTPLRTILLYKAEPSPESLARLQSLAGIALCWYLQPRPIPILAPAVAVPRSPLSDPAAAASGIRSVISADTEGQQEEPEAPAPLIHSKERWLAACVLAVAIVATVLWSSVPALRQQTALLLGREWFAVNRHAPSGEGTSSIATAIQSSMAAPLVQTALPDNSVNDTDPMMSPPAEPVPVSANSVSVPTAANSNDTHPPMTSSLGDEGYVIQCGRFDDAANALALAEELQAVEPALIHVTAEQVVLAGPYPTRRQALSALGRLESSELCAGWLRTVQELRKNGGSE
jgi:cell division septation protein DedD